MKASWMKCICATHFYIYLVLRSMLIPARHRVNSSQLNSLYNRLWNFRSLLTRCSKSMVLHAIILALEISACHLQVAWRALVRLFIIARNCVFSTVSVFSSIQNRIFHFILQPESKTPSIQLFALPIFFLRTVIGAQCCTQTWTSSADFPVSGVPGSWFMSHTSSSVFPSL